MKNVYTLFLLFLIAVFLVSGCVSAPIKKEPFIPEYTEKPKPTEISTETARNQLSNRDLKGLKSKTIEEILALPDEQIDLCTAILLISRKDYRNLFNYYIYIDIDKYRKIVDEIALDLIREIEEKSEPAEIIQFIIQYVSQNFSYISSEKNPQYQFLNFVLDERKGNSMGLSLLLLSIAERIGIHLYGVNAYDHIFLR